MVAFYGCVAFTYLDICKLYLPAHLPSKTPAKRCIKFPNTCSMDIGLITLTVSNFLPPNLCHYLDRISEMGILILKLGHEKVFCIEITYHAYTGEQILKSWSING